PRITRADAGLGAHEVGGSIGIGGCELTRRLLFADRALRVQLPRLPARLHQLAIQRARLRAHILEIAQRDHVIGEPRGGHADPAVRPRRGGLDDAPAGPPAPPPPARPPPPPPPRRAPPAPAGRGGGAAPAPPPPRPFKQSGGKKPPPGPRRPPAPVAAPAD